MECLEGTTTANLVRNIYLSILLKEYNMKIKTLALVMLSALTSAAAYADTTSVNGGTVHFKGEVVNAACAVDAGSIDQTVQLGQVRSAKLAGWRNR